jgi:hypothetical protein
MRSLIFSSCTALVMLQLIAVACSEPNAPLRRFQGTPANEIFDAVHGGGNSHFYLLPPMVPAVTYRGTTDATVSPQVTVCEWSGAGCVAAVAQFSTTSGTGSEVIRYDAVAEAYIVNWHTDQCITGPCILDPAKTYRIVIGAGISELGFADVAVLMNGSQLKNVDTNGYVPLVDGRTLPIRFRVEQGAGA